MGERLKLVRGLLFALAFLTCFVLLCFNMWDATHVINLVLQTSTKTQNINITVLTWLSFILVALLVTWIPKRFLVTVIMGGAVILGVIAVSAPPNTSTDDARYNWDGIVQVAGVSPYRYVPADAHLTALRPAWLFPAVTVKDGVFPSCPTGDALTTNVQNDGGMGSLLCTAINRPRVPTIYPPTAELIFVGVRLLVPSTVTYLPLQLFALGCLLGVTVLLLLLLRRARLHQGWAVLWAWCPLVLGQGVTNAHIDIAGVLLSVLGTMFLTQGKHVRGGIVFALAIMTKFLPVILLLPLLRRKAWVTVTAVSGTILAGYAIYLLGGVDVFGYLSGYLQEEGYDSGSRSVLTGLLVPDQWTTILAAVAFLGVLLWVWRHLKYEPWLAQLILFGTALLLASPRYPWYALTLVPLIVMTRRWEWLTLGYALTLRQFDAHTVTFQTNLLLAVLVILIVGIVRMWWADQQHLPRNNFTGWDVNMYNTFTSIFGKQQHAHRRHRL